MLRSRLYIDDSQTALRVQYQNICSALECGKIICKALSSNEDQALTMQMQKICLDIIEAQLLKNSDGYATDCVIEECKIQLERFSRNFSSRDYQMFFSVARPLLGQEGDSLSMDMGRQKMIEEALVTHTQRVSKQVLDQIKEQQTFTQLAQYYKKILAGSCYWVEPAESILDYSVDDQDVRHLLLSASLALDSEKRQFYQKCNNLQSACSSGCFEAVVESFKDLSSKACARLANSLFGKTRPIVHAASRNFIKIVDFLIDKGAEIQAQKGSSSPLHYAASGGAVAVVALLIEKGAVVDAVGEDGNTPLHIAIKDMHRRVAIQLVLAGASTDIKNADQKTPLQLGLESSDEEMKSFFQKKELSND